MRSLRNQEFYPALEDTIALALKCFTDIPPARRKLLETLAEFIRSKSQKGESVELIFICTHNSRRSHIAQIWAQAAAAFYNIPNVVTYSGGTEATAFNPRAVEALEKAGFQLARISNTDNPRYSVSFSKEVPSIVAYSKTYDSEVNPREGFAAIMTCSQADANCPIVFGMEKRISIAYDDPKDFDDTPEESEKYSERVMEIGRDLLYAFSQINFENGLNRA